MTVCSLRVSLPSCTVGALLTAKVADGTTGEVVAGTVVAVTAAVEDVEVVGGADVEDVNPAPAIGAAVTSFP